MEPDKFRHKDRLITLRPILLWSLIAIHLCILSAARGESTPSVPSSFPSAPLSTQTQIPDLVYQQVPFEPYRHPDEKFIDYSYGSDSNEGSREKPWKHHPWDPKATGNAATDTTTGTFVFKKGVIYRGTLKALRSGTPEKPIRLTIDPAWGEGDAILTGAELITGKWQRCNPDLLAKLSVKPVNQTWCKTGNFPIGTRHLWNTSNNVTHLPLARKPNRLKNIQLDSRANWGHLKRIELDLPTSDRTPAEIQGTHQLVRRFYSPVFRDTPDLEGGTLWIEKKNIRQPVSAPILQHDPIEGYITALLHLAAKAGPEPSERYFIEGIPSLIDSDREFAIAPLNNSDSLLLLRLPGAKPPHDIILEMAVRPTIIDIRHQRNIEISGLTFRFVLPPVIGTRDARHAPLYSAAIQIRGNSSNINVHHCNFSHLEYGLVAHPADPKQPERIDNILVSDNRFQTIFGSAVAISNGRDWGLYRNSGSRVFSVSIMRNHLEDIGFESVGRSGIGTVGHAIEINGAEVVEVAYNHINRTSGSGINVWLGSDYERGQVARPLLRGQIHHNKVTNSLLGVQDFGGIETWYGGPIYVYNNISINPVGYHNNVKPGPRHAPSFKRHAYGVGIYLDGQYKGYVFNNIVWGHHNDMRASLYNAAGFNEAAGFLNQVFHNTLMNFSVGIHKGGRQHERSIYLANLLIDMGHQFIKQETRNELVEIDTLGYTKNLFVGDPGEFGQLGRGKNGRTFDSLAEWQRFLRTGGTYPYDTGMISSEAVIMSKKIPDFHPRPGSAAIDGGAKVFVPWALSRVVGEWHFRKTSNPERVLDESVNFNQDWIRRNMAHDIPRNDLLCKGSSNENYLPGTLESWTAGALHFDGNTKYCMVSNSAISRGFKWFDPGKNKQSGFIDGHNRDTLDIGKDDFIIELVLKVDEPHHPAGIVSKRSGRGYSLDLNDRGQLTLTLDDGDNVISAQTSRSISDRHWHHVLVEADRNDTGKVRFFIDGVAEDVTVTSGSVHASSLSNNGDFLVGRSAVGHFAGEIDFLRVSKGTLADARTTIEALYQWEFDGPFLRDFSGNKSTGRARDIGAVEYLAPP